MYFLSENIVNQKLIDAFPGIQVHHEEICSGEIAGRDANSIGKRVLIVGGLSEAYCAFWESIEVEIDFMHIPLREYKSEEQFNNVVSMIRYNVDEYDFARENIRAMVLWNDYWSFVKEDPAMYWKVLEEFKKDDWESIDRPKVGIAIGEGLWS